MAEARKEEARKEDHYNILVVKLGNSVVTVYAPTDILVCVGYEVELQNGARGKVLMSNDWNTYEELIKYETASGEELQKAVAVFARKEVKWNE